MSRSALLAFAALSLGAISDARADRPRFGAMVDLGVPSGASASAVYRPVRALRFHAGGGHNLVAPGVQAGVSLAPLATWISPTLTVEAGRFFPGDANPAVERFTGEPSELAPERIGYDFASAQVGLELGREWATFYLHAGVSYLRGAWHGEDAGDEATTTTMTEVDVRAVGVSARLGFIFYFAR